LATLWIGVALSSETGTATPDKTLHNDKCSILANFNERTVG